MGGLAADPKCVVITYVNIFCALSFAPPSFPLLTQISPLIYPL